MKGQPQWRMYVADASSVGACRREAQKIGQRHRFDEVVVGRAAIVATELAANVVRHAGSGEILIQVLDDGVTPQLEVLAIDKGPGMVDVEECLRDGFSTTGTPGTGLGAVSRMSSTFDLYSAPGIGTVVLSRIAAAESAGGAPGDARPLEFGAVCIPVNGEVDCGDAWHLADSSASAALLVADGLGHGPFAAAASRAATTAFSGSPFADPVENLHKLHRELSGTRGAAVACALMLKPEGKIRFAGIGNIGASVIAQGKAKGLSSHNGIVGLKFSRSQLFEYEWPSESRLVMHSDGLSGRWDLAAYPGLGRRHPGIVAALLYRDFSRGRDDIAVVVTGTRQ